MFHNWREGDGKVHNFIAVCPYLYVQYNKFNVTFGSSMALAFL